MSVALQYEPVIGLEVHAQLLTRSKMFCSCSARYIDSPPNTHVCAVCGGFPGALPVVNGAAVGAAVRVALALHCRVPEVSKFDRKNYSYPDLPKGYQISQYDMPIGEGGWLEHETSSGTARCGIVRVHLEEDTGKTTHTRVDGRDVSLIDYNRSGVPLMEIVSEPELHSPEAARDYFAALRQVLMYLGVNDGNLQEGSLRADVNVSLRGPDGLPGTKVEIKNLNSFRAVQRSLEYEIERQRRVLDNGDSLIQETRGWSETHEVTVSQRSKEYASDYRYFPEPDLPPLVLAGEEIAVLAADLPEMPAARRRRYTEGLGLSAGVARTLTGEPALAHLFDEVLGAGEPISPTGAANWLVGDVLRILNENGEAVATLRLSPDDIARLVSLVEGGTISTAAGKRVLEEMFRTGESPDVIVSRENLAQIVDVGSIEGLVDDALQANPNLVETYRRGKTNVIQALVGKVMQASSGKASPPLVREILERKLATDS